MYPLWLFPRLKSVVRQGTFDQPRLASPPFPLTDHFKSRIRYGFVFSAGLFTLLWIWVLIVQHDFETNPPEALDWTSPGFGRAFGVYIMLQTAGNMVQNYLYFLMGTLGDGTLELSRSSGLLRGVESWGQCASFGISSRYVSSVPGLRLRRWLMTECSKFSPFYTTVINVVFWTVSLVPAAFTVWGVQGVQTHRDNGETGGEDVPAELTEDEKKSVEPRV